MALALDNLIQAYTPVLAHSPASPHTLCSQRLGAAFMDVIMMPLFSEETLSTLSPQQLQLYAQQFLTVTSRDKQVSAELLTHIIGRYITDYFAAAHLDLIQEIQGIFQHFLSNHQSTIPPAPSAESSQSEGSQRQASYDPGELHVKKVLDYLTELEAPCDEIQLLCKHMEWQWKINQYIPQENQFQAVAEIHFDFQSCKQTLRGVFVYKQKKFAKTVAIFKVLRNVYLGYPKVWSIMEAIKLKQNILIKKSINLLKTIPAEVLNEKIEPKYLAYRKVEQNKENYLSRISSFKAELSLLNQHCPNTFKFICLKTELPNYRWRVQGQLTVNFESKERMFEWSFDDTSSKLAEDVVLKRLIEAVYGEYVDIFHKMAAVKRKKNIHT